MSLVAILERHHPGTARKEAMVNPSLTETRRSRQNRKSVATFDETAKSVATFDVDRCVIGTKLETYFLSAGDKGSLAKRWTTFADELIRFSATPNLRRRQPKLSAGEETGKEAQPENPRRR